MALGPAHEATIDSRYQLSTLLAQSGFAVEEIDARRRLASSLLQAFGARNVRTFHAEWDLAVCLAARGDLSEAIELAGSLESRLPEMNGCDDYDEEMGLRLRRDLALFLASADRIDEAITLGRGLVISCTERFGASDLVTLSARGDLVTFLSDGGYADEAMEIAEEVWMDTEQVLGGEHVETEAAKHKFKKILIANKRID